MESATGSAQSTTSANIISTTSTAVSTTPAAAANGATVVTTCSNTASVLVTSGSLASSVASSMPTNVQQVQLSLLGQQQLLPMLSTKQDDSNTANLSVASGVSEGQRSLSGAPSASSSPILSPSGKIFGRNANGTMVATSRPSNEAEIQLYRVLQRASLLIYYDTLLEMGGDDVQQLYEAGEEEFLEIMALVGMASKPLHVRRLQKVLHEWANNPALFQGPITPSIAGLETPTKTTLIFTPEPSPSSLTRSKFPNFNQGPAFNPTPLLNTAQTSSSHLLSQVCTPAISSPVPVIQPHNALAPLPTSLPSVALASHQATGSTAHQVTSSSPQLTPVLTDIQISRITLGAEKIANQLPQREPRAQTSKKRTSRELEQVMAMSETNPRRMDEIRKYSAIYGRFDCKRRPEKPLTLHEVCVNEAAAQLCRMVPALLTRRDELFPLARQIVKDAGFGHSASIARYGGLIPQMQTPSIMPRSGVLVDCESSDSASAVSSKRQRLFSTETALAPDLSRDSAEDSRYNLFAMYQKFAKPSFDLSEIARFSLSKSDFDDNDNDNDNDSRLSYSNSSSPPMPHNGSGSERNVSESAKLCDSNEALTSVSQSCTGFEKSSASINQNQLGADHPGTIGASTVAREFDSSEPCTSRLIGVQVISAAGGHIIAVANPALALSPTLNETLSLKREAESPDN